MLRGFSLCLDFVERFLIRLYVNPLRISAKLVQNLLVQMLPHIKNRVTKGGLLNFSQIPYIMQNGRKNRAKGLHCLVILGTNLKKSLVQHYISGHTFYEIQFLICIG